MNKNRKWMYAPLRYDKVFKAFFTDKGNDKFLKALLRHYLLIPVSKNDEIVFVNTEFKPASIDDKMSRTDIVFELKKAGGEIINLEIQVQNKYNLIDRISYYNSKMQSSSVSAASPKGNKNLLYIVLLIPDWIC